GRTGTSMHRNGLIALALLAAALAGCGTRSISNSGYQQDGYYGSRGNELYQGEISELDLFVPPERSQNLSGDIKAALADNHPVTAELGRPLLVVQSGALVPDAPMTAALKDRFQVAPFSGIPDRPAPGTVTTVSTAQLASFGERLRLAAAQGGY